ncbi:unnamed protein product [Rotaria sordida]|uniref:RING-type domain-containing protein n=1 Tax=Rotaria sordida TaxID=392033 RepID=A0A815AKD1_9BILA|nr:unnamed protein product [Rotaria sordida]
MVGIDARNKHILDTKYICPVCSLILREPVQLTECGHRLCQTCLSAEQETTIKCRQCQTETSRIEMMFDRGFTNEMKSLSIDCSFCQWTGILNNYQEHLDQFHSNLNCESCDEHFNSVDKFNEHKVFECSKLIVECILKGLGCNERFICAKKKNHYLTEQHQQAIIKLVHQISSQFNDRQMDIDLSRSTTAGACIPPTVQFEEVYEMLNILASDIETLVNDEQRLRNESLQMQVTLTTLKEESSKLKLSVEELNTFLEGVKQNQDILNQDFVSLQEKINDLQYISYDGTLIWKIKNFHEKMSKLKN